MRTEFAYLGDILDPCNAITQRIDGLDFDGFTDSPVLQDAVHCRPIIIGEAVRYLTPPTLALMPEIPWQRIKGMRNFLIHEYDGVDAVLVWDVLKNHLPPLIKAVERVLPKGD